MSVMKTSLAMARDPTIPEETLAQMKADKELEAWAARDFENYKKGEGSGQPLELMHEKAYKAKKRGEMSINVKKKGKAELYKNEGTLFLRVVSDECKVGHEEHNTVTIPQGDYEIGIVKEYDHWKEAVRNVKD